MILLNDREIQFSSFPNGETMMQSVISAQELVGEPVNTISFKYENDSDLVKLIFLRNHIDTLADVPCELIIYYMPYSRMDRSEGGSLFTLKYVAKMINGMNFHTVYVVEPHSDVTTALLDNCHSIMVTKQLLDVTLNSVDFDLAEDYVVYPDAGAQKRYAKYFDGNVLVAHKERDFETGHIKKLDLLGVPFPKPEGRKAIIVDDLCSKGGTFILTAKALKEQGFKEIYLLVAHCEDTIFQGEVFASGLIDMVITTDSILTTAGYWANQKYKGQLVIHSIEDILLDK